MLGDSLGTDDGTELCSLDDAFDGNNDGNLDGSTLGVSLVGSPDETDIPTSKSGAGVGRTLLGTDDGCPGLGLLDGNVVGCSVAGSQHSQLS